MAISHQSNQKGRHFLHTDEFFKIKIYFLCYCRVLRPGDPGFCPRARVPVPSSKDYIIRPKSNVEEGMSDNKKVIK